MLPPVALLAIAFAVGIAGEQALDPGRAVAAALALGGTLGLLVAWRRGRSWGVAAMAHAMALGGLAAAVAWPEAPAGLLGGQVVVAARVIEAPERAFGSVHVLLGLEEVERDGRARAASGRVWLRVPGEPRERLLPGDRVRFRGQLRAPRGFAEPDAPDPSRRFAERGVIAVAGLGSADALVRLDGGEARSLGRTVAGWRARLDAEVAARLDGERRALVESLVLGERGGVSREVDEAFRLAGVSHVLSVSGLHLAVAAFLFYVGLRRLLVRIGPLARRVAVRRIAAVAALPATALYTLLTGAAVATVRSCVVAWVWLLGAALLRPPATAAAFGVAALVILGASPLALYDPSFQLSFAAALGGALLVRPMLGDRLAGRGLGRRIGRFFLGMAATSAAAFLATAPIAAWHFGQASPAGLGANPAVVPIAELWVVPVGLSGAVLSVMAPRLGGPLLRLAGVGAAAMAWVTRRIAALPLVATLARVPAPSLFEAAAWYGALLALALGGRRGARLALLCLVGCGGSMAARALAPRLFPALRVSFLDVGQGDSCLVTLPDGKTLLVDGGGSFDAAFDPGEQILVPWLERRGVRRLDIVVLTHPHPDHANGLASVVDHFPVGEVWTSGAVSALPGLVRLEGAAARRGTKVARPHPLDGGGAHLEVLHPIVGGEVRPLAGWSENDGSIVLRVSYGGRAVLLAGDVETRAERRLVAAGASLRADVLKAPHHGSRTSSTPPFVAAVAPEVVVFSVGSANRWGFPAPEVDARYRSAGARTFRTDLDGAVTVAIDARGHIGVATARRR